MGYVFDAMNEADDVPAPKADSAPPSREPIHSALPGDTHRDASGANGNAVAAAASVQAKALTAQQQETAQTSDGALPDGWQPRVIDLTPRRLAQMDDRLVTLRSPSSQMGEEYRSIRTSLLARWSNRRNIIHTITSATPQEGKTITSLNLGLSLAELRNRRTLVLEADLRLPMIGKLLKINAGPGLVQYLRGEVPFHEVVHRLGRDGLDVVVAGDRAANDAVQLLSGPHMHELLAMLRHRYDHVIVDTPPVIELADAGILGAVSDEVLLIARMNRTPRTLVEQAVRTLNSYNAPMGGVIATDRNPIRGRYYYYRYGYRHGYRYTADHAA